MKRRTFVLSGLTPLALASCGGSDDVDDATATSPKSAAKTTGNPPADPAADTASEARDAMKRAATYMDERVSYRGAYVWGYLADLSISWGEMEAKRTMCWIQPPRHPFGRALAARRLPRHRRRVLLQRLPSAPAWR